MSGSDDDHGPAMTTNGHMAALANIPSASPTREVAHDSRRFEAVSASANPQTAMPMYCAIWNHPSKRAHASRCDE